MDYAPLVLEHFDAPANAGPLPPGPGTVLQGRAGDREQGILVEFRARVDGGRIAAIVFRCFGCPHAVAACSLATRRLEGAPVAALGALAAADLAAALSAPREKLGRLLIVEDALRKCLSAWENSGL